MSYSTKLTISIFLLILFFFSPTLIPSESETPEESKLKSNLQNSTNTEKIKIYQSLSEMFLYKSSEKVIKYATLAKKYATESDNIHEIARANLNLGIGYLQSGKIDDAYNYYHSGLVLGEKVNDNSIIGSCLNGIASVHFQKGKLKKSLEYVKRSNLINEKLFSSDALKKIAELQKIQQLAVVKKEQKIRELEIKKQKLLTLYITTAFIFISLLALLLYQRFKAKAKSNQELNLAYKRMEKLAKLDPLTQLYNRRSITERIEIEMIKMSRTWRPFCLVMIDVDNFKEINDKYGHACGDKILESLALILIENLRKQDAASRWGGEEFLLMLPETSLDGGSVIAEKIRKKVENAEITFDSTVIKFTITLGIDEYNRIGPASSTIKRADSAMYEGKRRGKNVLVRSDDRKLEFPEMEE